MSIKSRIEKLENRSMEAGGGNIQLTEEEKIKHKEMHQRSLECLYESIIEMSEKGRWGNREYKHKPDPVIDKALGKLTEGLNDYIERKEALKKSGEYQEGLILMDQGKKPERLKEINHGN